MQSQKKIKESLKEADIEHLILNYLNGLKDCVAWKNPTVGYFDAKKGVFRKQVSRYAINGVSDILGIYKGRMLAIEVKRPQNKERPDHQTHFINMINRHGGIAFFATSIDDVVRGLEVCSGDNNEF